MNTWQEVQRDLRALDAQPLNRLVSMDLMGPTTVLQVKVSKFGAGLTLRIQVVGEPETVMFGQTLQAVLAQIMPLSRTHSVMHIDKTFAENVLNGSTSPYRAWRQMRRTASITSEEAAQAMKNQYKYGLFGGLGITGYDWGRWWKGMLKSHDLMRQQAAPVLYRGASLPPSFSQMHVGSTLKMRTPSSWTGSLKIAERYAGRGLNGNHAIVFVIRDTRHIRTFRYDDSFNDEHFLLPGRLTIDRIQKSTRMGPEYSDWGNTNDRNSAPARYLMFVQYAEGDHRDMDEVYAAYKAGANAKALTELTYWPEHGVKAP